MYYHNFINYFIYILASAKTQNIIDSKLVKRSRTVYAPERQKTMMVFVDDLNMPQKEKYEAQPPIEILRQWLEQKVNNISFIINIYKF